MSGVELDEDVTIAYVDPLQKVCSDLLSRNSLKGPPFLALRGCGHRQPLPQKQRDMRQFV
jgi:hypothetical protein